MLSVCAACTHKGRNVTHYNVHWARTSPLHPSQVAVLLKASATTTTKRDHPAYCAVARRRPRANVSVTRKGCATFRTHATMRGARGKARQPR